MSDQDATWVYAVVPPMPAAALETTSGITGEPVRLVAHADLRAVVGGISAQDVEEEALRRHLEDPAWLEHAARSHHRVVAACFEAAPTVPFRLATVYLDDQRVIDMLAQRRAELTDALATVARRSEWGVQAFTALEATPDTPPAVDGDPARPGTAYLLRRRAQRSAAEAVRRSAAQAAEALHAALQDLAVAARRHPPSTRPPAGPDGTAEGPIVLNAAYLLDDHRRETFTAAAHELGQQHPALRLRMTGPWPAYSFVEIGEEAPA